MIWFVQIILCEYYRRTFRSDEYGWNIDVGISKLFCNLINVVSVYHADRI